MTWAAGYLYMLASSHSRLTLPIGVAQVRFNLIFRLWYLFAVSFCQKSREFIQKCVFVLDCKKRFAVFKCVTIYKFGVFAPNHPHLNLLSSIMGTKHKILTFYCGKKFSHFVSDSK